MRSGSPGPAPFLRAFVFSPYEVNPGGPADPPNPRPLLALIRFPR